MRNKVPENGLFLIGDVQGLKLKKGKILWRGLWKGLCSINKGEKEVKKKLSTGCQPIFLIVVQKKTQGPCPFPDDHILGILWVIWDLKYVLSIYLTLTMLWLCNVLHILTSMSGFIFISLGEQNELKRDSLCTYSKK